MGLTRGRQVRFLLAVAVASAACGPAPALASPAPPTVVASSTAGAVVSTAAPQAPAVEMPAPQKALDLGEVDAVTREAVELERRIDEVRSEQAALESRLAVTSDRIQRQREDLAVARARLEEARAAYSDRLVEMYKSFESNPLALVLSSRTLQDLFMRSDLLSRLLHTHRTLLDAALLAAAETEHEKSVLDDLRRQDVLLRQLLRERLRTVQEALTRQKVLDAKLSAGSRKVLVAQRDLNAMTRKQWRASSIPLGLPIRKVDGTVSPYAERFLVSEFHPASYKATGVSFTAVCSWYGNEFHGRPSASGQIFNQDDFTCASKTLPFGTRLALRRGDKRIVVVVTDRGPFIAGRDLDLSRAAARALGFSGVQQVQAEIVTVVR